MALGGGSPPPMPAPAPVTPVPQEDDPKSLDAQRKTAIAAKNRGGYSAHLLSAGADTEKPQTDKAQLLGGAGSGGSGSTNMIG